MSWIRTLHLKKYRFCIWLILAIPAIFISASFLTGNTSYGRFIHLSGDWSIAFLVLAMFVTPVRRHFPDKAWVKALIYHRRALGVASFMYAGLHTAAYLERKWGANLILKEAQEPGLVTAWIALLLFALLAITSNNKSVKALKSRWHKIHRLVYPAALLAFAHWILTAFAPATAYFWLSAFTISQLVRFLPRKHASTKKPTNN